MTDPPSLCVVDFDFHFRKLLFLFAISQNTHTITINAKFSIKMLVCFTLDLEGKASSESSALHLESIPPLSENTGKMIKDDYEE